MSLIRQTQKIVVAADASGRATFAPESATAVWRLDYCTLLPNATSAVDGTNYATVEPKRGSTSLGTAHSTATTALTQNTPVSIVLTTNTSYREITQAAPLHVLADATPGSGVAVDVSVAVAFTELRA